VSGLTFTEKRHGSTFGQGSDYDVGIVSKSLFVKFKGKAMPLSDFDKDITPFSMTHAIHVRIFADLIWVLKY
jgi:hypothetical protein